MHNFSNEYGIRETGCWRCRRMLSSNYQKSCPICGWLICPDCLSCSPKCKHKQAQEAIENPFDANGLHKNGTRYDENGVDCNGKHKDYELYVGKRVNYSAIYGKGTISDCYFNNGSLRVSILFDSKKTIRDLAIVSALEKEIVEYIDD